MTDNAYTTGSGPVDGRYLGFLETISTLRPMLHRYCARMTGSVMDGEDVVQEALIEAYRKLDLFDDSRPFKPWLFRIAHNRCIDFLRRKGVRDEAEAAAPLPAAVAPGEPVTLGVGKAVEHLVATLPPKERACVLLKDVLDYSLEETAQLVESTVGGVKAALSRARTKLAASAAPAPAARTADPELLRIMRLYVERFNRGDWEGVRELISADARLLVADRFAGSFADARYFFNYEAFKWAWKLEVGELEHEPVIIILRGEDGAWGPHAVIRVSLAGGRIDGLADYVHCPWIVAAATSVSVAPS